MHLPRYPTAAAFAASAYLWTVVPRVVAAVDAERRGRAQRAVVPARTHVGARLVHQPTGIAVATSGTRCCHAPIAVLTRYTHADVAVHWSREGRGKTTDGASGCGCDRKVPNGCANPDWGARGAVPPAVGTRVVSRQQTGLVGARESCVVGTSRDIHQSEVRITSGTHGSICATLERSRTAQTHTEHGAHLQDTVGTRLGPLQGRIARVDTPQRHPRRSTIQRRRTRSCGASSGHWWLGLSTPPMVPPLAGQSQRRSTCDHRQATRKLDNER